MHKKNTKTINNLRIIDKIIVHVGILSGLFGFVFIYMAAVLNPFFNRRFQIEKVINLENILIFTVVFLITFSAVIFLLTKTKFKYRDKKVKVAFSSFIILVLGFLLSVFSFGEGGETLSILIVFSPGVLLLYWGIIRTFSSRKSISLTTFITAGGVILTFVTFIFTAVMFSALSSLQ